MFIGLEKKRPAWLKLSRPGRECHEMKPEDKQGASSQRDFNPRARKAPGRGSRQLTNSYHLWTKKTTLIAMQTTDCYRSRIEIGSSITSLAIVQQREVVEIERNKFRKLGSTTDKT